MRCILEGEGLLWTGRFTHPAAQPPVSPPQPDLGSAQALPPRSFNPAAACAPHPPATGIHFSRPNFNPGVTAASLLADPDCSSQTQVSESSSAPTEPRLFSLNPQPSAPSPAQVPTLPGGLLEPDRPAGEGCPTPLALPGSLASLKSLNRATSGPRAPAVNSSSNSAAPAESTHRAPPSPCLAWPLSDLGLGGCLRRGPASREARRGRAAPPAERGGRGPWAPRGSGQSAQSPGPGSGGRRGKATGGVGPGTVGPGTAAAAGGRGCYQLCACGWGVGGRLCA